MAPAKTKPQVTAIEITELLRYPEARQAAIAAGWTQGAEVDVRDLTAGMAEHGYFVTGDLAWDVGRRQGHNLRCNRCGTYGATWVPEERPGWGSLALCPPHKQELADEHQRHRAALDRLRKVHFEQPAQAVRRERYAIEW